MEYIDEFIPIIVVALMRRQIEQKTCAIVRHTQGRKKGYARQRTSDHNYETNRVKKEINDNNDSQTMAFHSIPINNIFEMVNKLFIRCLQSHRMPEATRSPSNNSMFLAKRFDLLLKSPKI